MKFTPVKNTGDQLTAEEYNETPSQELQNAVLSSGQALIEADEFQLGQAMAVYGSAGDFYGDSGLINAYILSPINIQQASPAYTNGLRLRFIAINTNTGISTVNLNGLGVKSIKENGSNLIAGRIVAGDIIEISFLTASDEFELVNFHTATLVSNVIATNGEVMSTVTFDDDGHIVTFTKRVLTASNGVTLVGDDFQHEDTSSVSDVIATGDEVISSITFDAQGHVLTFTKRSLTPANIGAEPQDDTLSAIAATDPVADQINYFTGLNIANTTGLTAFGRDFVDSVDAAAGRTVLGLGTIATFLGNQNLRSTDNVNFDQITAAGRLRTDNTDQASSTSTAALQTDGGLGVVKNIVYGGKLRVGLVPVLVISGGVITATASFHKVDTESAAATDDLDTISGGSNGERLIIMSQFIGRTIVVKDGTGNLRLNGDFSMDSVEDTMELAFNNSVWNELSRSNNG